PGAYEEVQRLLKSIGGTMKWQPGGGPGGVWELHLRGKMHPVEVRNDQINALDELYVPQVDNPKTLHDYGSPGTLVDDAFWRLVDLFER
ncbi:MAG: hypothetical protein M3P49_08640, partial [Actinomycetota bacterium]|nr:hypothetical protein [Actinomycetota bacterium]